MSFESFSTKWFTIYYSVLGLCLLGAGSYLVLKQQVAAQFLRDASDREKPPPLFIRILKYFFLFTLPGLVLSFMPFAWIELIFTIWSLLLVYIVGIQLVRWEQSRTLIKASADHLPQIVRRSGAIMVAVGLAILLLAYLVIKRTSF